MFWSCRLVWEKCTEWLKMTLIKGQTYTMYKSNFSSFCYTAHCFSVTCYIEKSVPNDPQMTLNSTRSNVPIYALLVSPNTNFQSVSLNDQSFCSYWPFWDKSTKWPQNELNITRLNLPHICVVSIPESQISLHFGSTTTGFKVVENRKCTEWPHDDFKHLNAKGILQTLRTYPIPHPPPPRTKFWATSLDDQPFSRYNGSRKSKKKKQKCTKWHWVTLNT